MTARSSIRVRTTTRSRLRRLKKDKTYDEFLTFLMGVIERLEEAGKARQYTDAEIIKMSNADRAWMKRNTKWKNGRMVAINLEGR